MCETGGARAYVAEDYMRVSRDLISSDKIFGCMGSLTLW